MTQGPHFAMPNKIDPCTHQLQGWVSSWRWRTCWESKRTAWWPEGRHAGHGSGSIQQPIAERNSPQMQSLGTATKSTSGHPMCSQVYDINFLRPGWLKTHRVIGFHRVVQAFNFLLIFLLSGFESRLQINHSLSCFSCWCYWLPNPLPKASGTVGHATPSGWCSVRLHPDRTAGIFVDAPLRLYPVYPDRVQNRSGLRLVGCLFARPWANLRTLSNIHSFDSDYLRNHNDFDALRSKVVSSGSVLKGVC